ncbi:FadR family transcriptional regulator [Chryseobacterium carnipullorum]|uniref:FadR family transcriptional regulator n=1 Tax=Chryseobacterium carnipullorum TaxID=1124835 RepID=A0A376DT65_CHRCU|nr:FadR/GntR family transcriptional regulator [Chryseobacterium carnipullorum]AZA49468.1 FadR family transcriptional regulator [Chryseobacterium carnipullorum]AZA64361.1 FadR family transcriptional regulator [Chryseobacterium carnipullorum]STC94408.1 L-lactate utilization operon repressor [Chryseobacterium carnipullorum]
MKNKIIRKSLAEEVAGRLEQDIVSGSYRVGDKLPSEPMLMEEYGVGRSSVREAVKMLENKGIISVQQGVGIFLASKTAAKDPLSKQLQRARTADVIEVRELLEMKIVEKAALNRTEEDIEALKKTLKKRNKAADNKDLLKWLEEDIAFHVQIAEASKNVILTSLYKTFAEQQLKSSIEESYSQDVSMHRLTKVHESLLDAIIRRSPEDAIAGIVEMRRL